MMTTPDSPYFEIPPSEWIAANRSSVRHLGRLPGVSGARTRHVAASASATGGKQLPASEPDIFDLVDVVRSKINELHQPDGFNVGFNAGSAAGQTVDHLHIHVIPRFAGDVPDPRGGIRNVIVARGNYLADAVSVDRNRHSHSDARHRPMTPVLIDGQVRLLLPELVERLRDVEFDRIDIVVSFIKMSGLNLLMGALEDALERGAHARILTTDYLGLTDAGSPRPAARLDGGQPGQVSVRLFHDPEISFHPKAYVFYSSHGPTGSCVRRK